MMEAALRESGGPLAGPSGAPPSAAFRNLSLGSKISSLKINASKLQNSQ
jgi:hypothetical protein